MKTISRPLIRFASLCVVWCWRCSFFTFPNYSREIDLDLAGFSKRIITLVLREWRSYRKDTQLLETCAIFPDQSLHTSLFRKHFLMCALRPARAIKNNKQTKKLTQRKSDGNNVTIGDSPSRRFKAGKQHTPSGLFMRSLSICANRWRQENF